MVEADAVPLRTSYSSCSHIVAVRICLSELFDSFDLDMDANPFPLEDRPVRSCHFTSHLHSPFGMVTKGTLVSR